MRAELRLSPVGFGPSFASKTFTFDRPATLEIDGHAPGMSFLPAPASDNAILPSYALVIDQAFVHFNGSSFTLKSCSWHSDSVLVNKQLLGDNIHKLKDGDVLRFGEYLKNARRFKSECAVRVHISFPPSPKRAPTTTNWPGVHKLLDGLRKEQEHRRPGRQSDSASPTSPTSPAVPLPSSTSSRPDPPPGKSYGDVINELHSRLPVMDTSVLPPAAISPASASLSPHPDFPPPCVESAVATPCAASIHHSPIRTIPTSGLTSVLGSVPASFCSNSTPTSDSITSSDSAVAHGAPTSPSSIVAPKITVGAITPYPDQVRSSVEVRDQASGSASFFSDAAATRTAPIVFDVDTTATHSSGYADSARIAVSRARDAWLIARRAVVDAGVATATVASARMRTAWIRARSDLAVSALTPNRSSIASPSSLYPSIPTVDDLCDTGTPSIKFSAPAATWSPSTSVATPTSALYPTPQLTLQDPSPFMGPAIAFAHLFAAFSAFQLQQSFSASSSNTYPIQHHAQS
ncbi:hypothetical protein A4X06_0g9456, partial [Tilletia controversa]